MRFEDTSDLFGRGCGLGTVGKVTCGICDTVYNAENETADGEIIDSTIDSTGIVEFAGMTVAECCWERLENEIIEKMPHILRWYARMLAAGRVNLNRREEILRDCLTALQTGGGI